MTLSIHWQLDVAAEPARGEPSARAALPGLIRDLRHAGQNRFDYYAQVAQAAAQTAFDGLYLSFRAQADETRIVAGALAREVRGLALIAEFPASVGSAVYAAKQAATFQRGAQGRLGWAIAPDDAPDARAARGDTVSDGDLTHRLAEFLTVARGVHGQRPFSFKGEFFEVEQGGFADPLNRHAFPPVYLRGDSEEALAVSARYGDIHLFSATADLPSSIAALTALAGKAGRQVAAGLLQPVLARESDEEAAQDAARQALPPGTLVGSFDTVAARLDAIAALGIGHVVLSASPQLEEAYRLGQHLLPRLRARLAARAIAA